MNIGFHDICLLVSIVLFALAAFAPIWWTTPKFGLTSAGLFFYALKDVFPK